MARAQIATQLSGPLVTGHSRLTSHEHRLDELMELSGIAGLALAVIDHGEVVFTGSYGVRNRQRAYLEGDIAAGAGLYCPAEQT